MANHDASSALSPTTDAAPAPSKNNTSTGDATDTAPGTTDNRDRDGQSGGRGRGRGGRGGRNGGSGKRKNKDQGRSAYNRSQRGEGSNKRAKREGWEEGVDGENNGEKEERKPKRKVAVLISYCGTGYKGMQLNPPHKSIEGDLFEAFVQAGAISKANSDDPKKSALVRCARTDKGVHAAGNVISLKLIIEDPDIVTKINSHLPDQIRVLDIIRTTGSFSAYQLCDSRMYEYLIPSYVFLPPHPQAYLGRACRKNAQKENDLEQYLSRQKDAEGWWDEVDRQVNEILEAQGTNKADVDKAVESDSDLELPWENKQKSQSKAENDTKMAQPPDQEPTNEARKAREKREAIEALAKRIRALHTQHMRSYRISPERLERVRDAFRRYVGTLNFHNYTIEKKFRDPSAKRHIKSFEVSDPIQIADTEWLSLKVHGQSFMMHQIRKMVGMAMMVVRTGCPTSRIPETFGERSISIAKVPGLGLLLESPQFAHYNEKTSKEHGRDPLDFSKYKDQIEAFKEKYIYSKIFEEEKSLDVFSNFTMFLDKYKNPTYLYVTSSGFRALDEAGIKKGQDTPPAKEAPSDESEEDVAPGSEEG